MKTALKRFFSSFAHKHHVVVRPPLTDIQNSWRHAVSDCRGVPTEHLIYRIDLATMPADLWALLGDIYQCIAQMHTENTAAQRINELVKLFEGWVCDSRLVKS